MSFLSHMKLSHRLMLLTSTSVLLGLLVACTCFWWNNQQTVRKAKIDHLQVMARSIAFNCAGALTFLDQVAANELLKSLTTESSIDQAVLYDMDGEIFAVYGIQAITFRELDFETQQYHILNDGRIVIKVPVTETFDANKLGTLLIVANSHDLNIHFFNFLMIVIATVVIALGVALIPLAILHQTVTRPILNLTEVATGISHSDDYSQRVFRKATDEIGFLYRAFNRLLDQVQQNEAKLMTAKNQISEAKQKAETANQAKTDFLANMSHEIRTPLTGILGFTDLMIGRDDLPIRERIEYLHTIRRSGRHLLSLINDILDLSKIEAGQFTFEITPVNPHQVLSEVVSVLRAKAIEKDLSFDYRWISDIPEAIEIDGNRLKQVLLNLLGNAIKFTHHGGVAITSRVRQLNDKWLFEVDIEDTGVGIPANKLDQIFDPFMQADNSVTRKFGGTGLGLAISKKITRLMNGRLDVASELGVGSTFRLQYEIPSLQQISFVTADVADGFKTVENNQSPTNLKLYGVQILLAEDGETNRKFFRIVLERAGAEVSVAENGQIALNKAIHTRYDLILMDMQMPVMDGYKATAELREHGYEGPIIALTAHAMTGDRIKCINVGCNDYITKPISQEDLVHKVHEVTASVISDHHAASNPQMEGSNSDIPVFGSSNSIVASLQSKPIASALPCDDVDFQEIVEDFLSSFELRLESMKCAFELQSYDELTDVAHWLKGAGGTAGFPILTEVGGKLEQASRRIEIESISLHLDQLSQIQSQIVMPWKTGSEQSSK